MPAAFGAGHQRIDVHADGPGASAVAYPNKCTKLFVPLPASGDGDTLAQLVMLRASKELGQLIDLPDWLQRAQCPSFWH